MPTCDFSRQLIATEGARDVIIDALSINSHEHTQSNEVCAIFNLVISLYSLFLNYAFSRCFRS